MIRVLLLNARKLAPDSQMAMLSRQVSPVAERSGGFIGEVRGLRSVDLWTVTPANRNALPTQGSRDRESQIEDCCIEVTLEKQALKEALTRKW